MQTIDNTVIQNAVGYVQELFDKDTSGHDWYHTDRVRKIAKALAIREGADVSLVELAALMHDVDDWKLYPGTDHAGATRTQRWLWQQNISKPLLDRVLAITAAVSYMGSGVKDQTPNLEADCVMDADRLDAMGAIGIARCFAFGGAKGRPMYDPGTGPKAHQTAEEYKASSSHSINHFYEKLLLLQERLRTKTGREWGRDRHEYMMQFLGRFMFEWNCGFQTFENCMPDSCKPSAICMNCHQKPSGPTHPQICEECYNAVASK